MGVWKEVPVEPEEGEEGEEEFVYKVVPNDITLKLPAARSVEDNPVHKTKILTVKENNRDIKVGYLMYNSFTAGTNSDPDKYNNEPVSYTHLSFFFVVSLRGYKQNSSRKTNKRL